MAVARLGEAREEAPRLEFGSDFHLPPSLEASVQFWVDVFTRYSLHEAVIHDRKNPAHVLALVRMKTGRTAELDALRKLYGELAVGLREASPDELGTLLAPFRPPIDPQWIIAAAERVRVQPGQREVFLRSLMRSTRYLPMLRRVLRDASVPEELAYLPHVESSFDVKAESSAGALGLWQLMPETARRYLRIDAKVDERSYPSKATAAAASYLREAYDQLHSWPLAITSYNYGINGTRRAVDALGTRKLHDVIERHDSPLFGFASKNFYAQFLAAVHVAQHEDYYFPEIREMRSREYVVQKGDTLWHIARRHGVTVEKIRSANRSLGASATLQLGQRIMMPG